MGQTGDICERKITPPKNEAVVRYPVIISYLIPQHTVTALRTDSDSRTKVVCPTTYTCIQTKRFEKPYITIPHFLE
jgi:hypothetical protein